VTNTHAFKYQTQKQMHLGKL